MDKLPFLPEDQLLRTARGVLTKMGLRARRDFEDLCQEWCIGAHIATTKCKGLDEEGCFPRTFQWQCAKNRVLSYLNKTNPYHNRVRFYHWKGRDSGQWLLGTGRLEDPKDDHIHESKPIDVFSLIDDKSPLDLAVDQDMSSTAKDPLDEAMAMVPQRDRELIKLRVAGLRWVEIAKQHGMSRQLVHHRVNEAFKVMATFLSRHHPDLVRDIGATLQY